MTFHEAHTQLKNELYFLYDHTESGHIADIAMEKITGLSKSERFINGLMLLNEEQSKQYELFRAALNSGKPIQQVTGEAWFHYLPFFVNEHVLIPRPETDELVEWITDLIKTSANKAPKILDIGTGSGCIAISLQKEIHAAEVHAIDISPDALAVAKKNAVALGAAVQFQQMDFLNDFTWSKLPAFDIIVSNPPYIRKSEAVSMHSNVLLFEPHTALFVEDADPLIFYRKIISFAEKHLKDFGSLFFEINEAFADEILSLLDEAGYDEIELRADMQGKDRMIRASFL